MDAVLFIAIAAIVAAVWTVLFLRRQAKRTKIDPTALDGTRLTGEGAGWLYEYGWPRRKKREKSD